MKTIYKSIVISILAISVNNAFSAEFDINSEEIVEESNIQLTFLPGFTETAKNPLVMQMVEPSPYSDNILKLNSSLDKPNNVIETDKYFDDIEVTNNNLLEIRF